jgi:outer membrane protein assembly factor BamB
MPPDPSIRYLGRNRRRTVEHVLMLLRSLTITSAVLLSSLVTAAAAPGCETTPSTSDWPAYGRDASNSRHQAEGAPTAEKAADLEIAWSARASTLGASGDFTGTPVIAGDCVFVGTNEGWVMALDRETGSALWTQEAPLGGQINSSLAVADGRVLAHVSLEGSPYLVALDADTGGDLWTRVTDQQPGSDAFASPIVHDGMVVVGVSGDAAQHSGEEDERGFAGSMVLVDLQSGDLIKRISMITPEETQQGFGGATVSAPPAIDADGFAYAGTSSAYIPQRQHPNNDALLKIDLRRTVEGSPNPELGRIVARYNGDTFDAVVPGYSDLPCADLPVPAPPAIVPTGRGVGACGDVDVDFAAAPNLLPGGMIAAIQKSGIVHAVDSTDMSAAWSTQVSIAQPFGGVSATTDGQRLVTGTAPPGDLVALDLDGEILWRYPIGDGAHYGLPVASGGSVAYTLDIRGALHAVDMSSGLPIGVYPLVDPASPGLPITFGGVSVASGTVFASVGFQNTGVDFLGIGDGLLIAFH